MAWATSSSVAQLAGEDHGLSPLGRHLAGVGEVGVVVEAAPVAEAELGQLRLELTALGFEQLPVVDGGGVGWHGEDPT